MFTVPAVVALCAGALITFMFGWEAFREWCAQIDTTEEAKEFFFDLAGALVGLSVIVTSIHSLVA